MLKKLDWCKALPWLSWKFLRPMRYFFHLALTGDDSPEIKLLPIFLHFNDLSWFSQNPAVIFDEVCDIILENLETIEKRARGVDNIADSRPTRLHSVTGKVALAFCTVQRRQFANYSILSLGPSGRNLPQFCGIYPFEVMAWIFSIDPKNPYAPLPIDCSWEACDFDFVMRIKLVSRSEIYSSHVGSSCLPKKIL